jgi:hypothetical protein
MIKKVNIAEIKPNEENPRFITDAKFKKLVKSIKEFPEMLETRPLVVDENMIVLGGNMRLKALKSAGVFEVPVHQVIGWSKEQKDEFIIKDNIGYGQWDWDVIANDWDGQKLKDWGMDLPDFANVDDFGTDFDLPDGDKEPFQQQTYTLADAQAEQIKNAIANIKKTEEFNYVETFGNENSNGNALYLIIMQWAEQKIL